ncbi:MAG: hypothetical protein JRD89_07570 [Deltaproteobacteria bacterium]|nr:hypothetical protein [Deltaproteobacteria bacterium]
MPEVLYGGMAERIERKNQKGNHLKFETLRTYGLQEVEAVGSFQQGFKPEKQEGFSGIAD